jgi:adenylyltransferase/sulfurtransferase
MFPDPSEPESIAAEFARYEKQIRFAPLGAAGQQRLANACCVIVGCGALGSVQAGILARAGIGSLRLVDRDFVESSNLQRQLLFTEADVAANLPKAIAAAAHLRQANSNISIEALVEDVHYGNVRSVCRGADVILDGTDNFETRFLLNDLAVEQGIPWVYGGCLGSEGQTQTIVPGQTPCLRCLMADGPPPPGTTATCDSAGVLGSIIGVIASLQACEAIKIAAGKIDEINRQLTVVDVWGNVLRQMDLSPLADRANCVCCGQRRFDWLAGRQASRSIVLCGRNSVQISAPSAGELSLKDLANRLTGVGRVERNEYLLKFFADECSLTVFGDGRAIISGTGDVAKAKAIYARYIGS